MAFVRGATFEIKGMAEVQAQFERIGKMPKKYLTKAAREGIADPLKDAKASVPVGKGTKTSGNLKKSIKKKMETPNKRNKGVYRITYDASMTKGFLKPTTGTYGGVTPFAYYPASVEYGFPTRGGKRVPGQYNIKKAIERHEKASTQKIVDSLSKSIEQLLK